MQNTNMLRVYLFKHCHKLTQCINMNVKYNLIVISWYQIVRSTLVFKFVIRIKFHPEMKNCPSKKLSTFKKSRSE